MRDDAMGRYPRLMQFFVGFLTAQDYPVLDPQLVVDDSIAISLRREHDLRGELADLDSLIAEIPDEDTALDDCDGLLRGYTPPDGTSMREWLVVQRGVVQEAIDGKALMPPPMRDIEKDGLRVPRASRFTDEEVADVAVTDLLLRHEDAFRAWAADRGGWKRQHYYADLGREVGRIQTAVGEPPGPATAVAAVLELDPESGNPFVVDAYPEIALDESIRQTYPDLCHWFGGWFGPYAGHPWSAIEDVNRSTTDPARSRVREQLTAVLRIDDDAELIRAIEACGSYALPQRMRPWLTRTLWRLDAFDWLGERAGS